MLARRVNAGGSQFSTREQQVEVIKVEWGGFDQTELKNFIESMPNHVCQVLEMHGKQTSS